MSCPDCFSGTVHTGEYDGAEIKLHDLDVYATGPSIQEAKGVIVMIPDAFGWKMPNNRIWADEVAKKGNWRILLPDFMNGNSADPQHIDLMLFILKNDSYMDWLWKPWLIAYAPFAIKNRDGVAWPRIEKFFKDLKTSPDYSNLPVGAAGFCFGGRYALRLTYGSSTCNIPHSQGSTQGSKKPLVDAAFMAHPAPLSLPSDAQKTVQPMSAAIGDKDWCNSVAKLDQLTRLFERQRDAGVHAEFVRYDGAGHGFAVRYDPGNSRMAEQAQEAQDQAVSWFKKHFKSI